MIGAIIVVAMGSFSWGAPACPTAADLKNGIVFVTELEAYNMHHATKHLGDGVMWRSWRIEGQPTPWQTYYADGLLELRSVRSDGGSLKDVIYSAGLAEAETLAPGQTTRVVFSADNANRGLTWNWTQTVKAGGAQTYDIAGCTYDGFPVRFEGAWTRSDGMTRTSSSSEIYIPELRYAFRNRLKPEDISSLRIMRDPGSWAVQPFGRTLADHRAAPAD